MEKFNFDSLADLHLTSLEMNAIHNIYDKQKVNQAFWQETPQQLIENFVRCLKVCLSEGINAVPSVVAAQGILESGWFSTHSMFGVKATKLQIQSGEATEESTEEVEEGQIENTKGLFFETPSVQNNFSNYFNYLAHRKPGTKQFLPANALGFVTYLQNPKAAIDGQGEPTGAYSTAGSEYIDSVMSVIHSNGFQAFDHF